MLNNEVQLTEDGREHQLQANHLGHFYLTNLLMDLVIPKEKSESDPSRIIIVSSEAHNFMRDVESFKKLVEVEFSSDPKAAYVSSKISFLGIQTYGFTKFLNILFGKKLHALYGSKGVFTASLHPGFVRTNIFTSSVSHESGASCALRCLFTALSPIFWYFGKPARNGAATSLYLSLDPEALAYGGEYFDNMILAKKKSPLNSDFELADQIWIRSLESIPQNQKPFPQ
jgi:WW domain-containing oxidoreductase